MAEFMGQHARNHGAAPLARFELALQEADIIEDRAARVFQPRLGGGERVLVGAGIEHEGRTDSVIARLLDHLGGQNPVEIGIARGIRAALRLAVRPGRLPRKGSARHSQRAPAPRRPGSRPARPPLGTRKRTGAETVRICPWKPPMQPSENTASTHSISWRYFKSTRRLYAHRRLCLLQ